MKGTFPIDKFQETQTPFYYYDTTLLRQTLKTINEEAGKHPGFEVHYAVKANANPKVLGIICVVGDLDWSNVGFETIATDAMKNIPVRMISYGGSNYNISFLIRERDKKQALQNLSNVLFEK